MQGGGDEYMRLRAVVGVHEMDAAQTGVERGLELLDDVLHTLVVGVELDLPWTIENYVVTLEFLNLINQPVNVR